MSKRADIESFIDRMFAGEEATPEEVAVVATVVGEDVDARAYYDSVARVDAALDGDFEARFGEGMFLAALDDMLAEEAAAPRVEVRSTDLPPTPAANTNRPLGMWIASVALVMFGLTPLLVPINRPNSEFQARTAAVSKQTGYTTPRFDVFCVERDGDRVAFRGPDAFEFGTVRCPQDGEIKFAASAGDARLRHAAFFGIAPDGRIYWYGPSPAAPSSIKAPHGERIRPLGETVRLDVNHAPGNVRVIGLFSEDPLEFSTIETIVRRNAMTLRDGEIEVPRGVVLRKTFEVSER